LKVVNTPQRRIDPQTTVNPGKKTRNNPKNPINIPRMTTKSRGISAHNDIMQVE